MSENAFVRRVHSLNLEHWDEEPIDASKLRCPATYSIIFPSKLPYCTYDHYLHIQVSNRDVVPHHHSISWWSEFLSVDVRLSTLRVFDGVLIVVAMLVILDHRERLIVVLDLRSRKRPGIATPRTKRSSSPVSQSVCIIELPGAFRVARFGGSCSD